MSITVTQQRVINAPAEKLFALLADIDAHARIDGSGNIAGKAQGPRPLHEGATFTMGMTMGVPYRTHNEVVEFEPGRVIAWRTVARVRGRKVFGGQIWRWELVPQREDRTLVRASFDALEAFPRPLFLNVMKADRRAEKSLAASLERLAELA